MKEWESKPMASRFHAANISPYPGLVCGYDGTDAHRRDATGGTKGLKPCGTIGRRIVLAIAVV